MDLDTDEGILIDDVVDDSPAEEAGLKKGDVIVRYGGSGVSDVSKLTEMVRKTEPGSDVEIRVLRDGRGQTLYAVIGAKEKDDQFDMKSFTLDFPQGLLKGFDFGDDPNVFSFAGGGKPRFGVGIQDIDGQLSEFFEVGEEEGVLVTEVYEDSPAEEAGVLAGDVIVEFDGHDISGADELITAVKSADADVAVDVELMRKGRAMNIEVVLPDTESRKKAADIYIHELQGDKELQQELEELKKELKKLKVELKELKSKQ